MFTSLKQAAVAHMVFLSIQGTNQENPVKEKTLTAFHESINIEKVSTLFASSIEVVKKVFYRLVI